MLNSEPDALNLLYLISKQPCKADRIVHIFQMSKFKLHLRESLSGSTKVKAVASFKLISDQIV